MASALRLMRMTQIMKDAKAIHPEFSPIWLIPMMKPYFDIDSLGNPNWLGVPFLTAALIILK